MDKKFHNIRVVGVEQICHVAPKKAKEKNSSNKTNNFSQTLQNLGHQRYPSPIQKLKPLNKNVNMVYSDIYDLYAYVCICI